MKSTRQPQAAASPALISNRRGGGRLNLAASLSPDGRRMVFLSERDQFSIDLFLADAVTGRVVSKLLTTATSADFESLQYLHSAGAWDSSGTRYALGTISHGRATLIILNVDQPSDRRELPMAGVDEVYSPTWSPDGTRIAFSALAGGVSDLSVVDLGTGAIRRLTNDPYADLQPAWSPDGTAIAFTTDRFTTDLASLAYGSYRIGLLDPASAAIVPAPSVAGINHLDPEWSGDGSLFFVGDPEGVPNVFRLDLASAGVSQVTGVTTAVAGVTPVSPALSVARDTGAIAFSVFRNGAYEVHRIDAPSTVETAATLEAHSGPAVAAADDGDRDAGIAPVPPLPAIAEPRERSDYSPRLSLEGIGSPYFSAGGGPLGSYVSGGASVLFGDLLGDHQLMTAAHISSRFDESAVGAMYVNRSSRWSWGVSLEQTPDVRVRTTGAELDPTREHAVTRTRERMLWTTRRLGGFAAYPLSRSRRVEIHGGIRAARILARPAHRARLDAIRHGVRGGNPAARQRPVDRHRRGWTGADRRHRRSSARRRRSSAAATGCRRPPMSASCNMRACSPTTAPM